MNVQQISFLELLHRQAAQNGWAVLLTATHHPGGFAERSSTALVNLDVVRPLGSRTPHAVVYERRSQNLRAGELVIRCTLDKVDGDLEAAAELLVNLLTHAQERAA